MTFSVLQASKCMFLIDFWLPIHKPLMVLSKAREVLLSFPLFSPWILINPLRPVLPAACLLRRRVWGYIFRIPKELKLSLMHQLGRLLL